MCVATIAAVAAVSGAAISATSLVAGGIAQGKAQSYQAQVARNNATIANQQATYAAQAGAENVARAGLKDRAKNANVRTQLAANGIDIGTGSAADVQTGARALGNLDTGDVAQRSALDVYGYRSQGASYKAQAALDQSAADFAPIGGALKGAGTLLSSAGKFDSLLSGSPSVSEDHAWMTGGWDQTLPDYNAIDPMVGY